MSTTIIDASESTILSRVMAINNPFLSTAVAEEILKWSFTQEDRFRMSELAAKAREGTLTTEERIEAEGFERVNSFLGLVKSKARRSLQAGLN